MYAARSFSGFVFKRPRSLFQIGNTVQKTPFSAAASFSIDLFAETLHQKMLGQLCTRARLDSHPVVTVWKDRNGEKFSVQWFLSKTSCVFCVLESLRRCLCYLVFSGVIFFFCRGMVFPFWGTFHLECFRSWYTISVQKAFCLQQTVGHGIAVHCSKYAWQ